MIKRRDYSLTGQVIESDLPLKPYVDRMREDVKSKGERA